MKNACVLAAAVSLGCADVQPEFRERACDAQYCLTSQRTQDGIHEAIYDVIFMPGYTMADPAYKTESFVVQVAVDSRDVWVAAWG